VRNKLQRRVLLAVLLLGPGLAQAKTSFTNSRLLTFGKFVAGPGGTVTVTTAGARSSLGVLLVGTTASSAAFTWSDNSAANASKLCAIGLPADGTVTLTSGANTMTLKSFTSTPAVPTMMTAGSLNFTVGATLTVKANQAPGTYSGSYSVTITYQ
jgi:hypothetical protein